MAGSALTRVAKSIVARRLQHRLGAAAVAVAFVGTSVPAVSIAAPDQEEIGRLYGEGQDYMEQKEFGRAAEVFTRLLNLIDESADNKAIRESLILNILDARIQAYDGIVDADGKRDAQQLYDGRDTLQKYYKDFQSVHGDSVAVIGEIQSLATKLDEKIKEHERDVDTGAGASGGDDTTTGGDDDTGDDTTLPPPPPPRQSNGTDGLGLIIGGVGLGVLGVGSAIMIPVGSSLGRSAERDYNSAQTEVTRLEGFDNPTDQQQSDLRDARNDRDSANDDGKRANAVLITGAVLTPLFVGGAVAMIVLGVKKRRNSSATAKRRSETLTASPSFGKGFSGFTLQGRF